MKKVFLMVTAAFMAIMLTACGMSQEQIAESLTNLDNAYQSGTYEQAKSELDKLDKAYNKMSDEQKNKFSELRPLVENAVTNAPAIQEVLNNAQNFYDQNMYDEAQAELDKLGEYQLPPTEKTIFDELQGNVSAAISTRKIDEALQNIEELYNNGDYDAASAAIGELDVSAATEEQNQRLTTLQQHIANAKAEKEEKQRAAAAAAKKKSEGISESQAKSIAAGQYPGMNISSVTSSDYLGTPVYIVEMHDPVYGDEIGVVVIKSTGNIATILT